MGTKITALGESTSVGETSLLIVREGASGDLLKRITVANLFDTVFQNITGDMVLSDLDPAVTISQTELAALDGVTGSLNYSTENYGATGTGDIVLSTGATLTTVNITDVIKLTPTASPPSGAVEGMVYADTDHHLYYHNGTTWIQLDNN